MSIFQKKILNNFKQDETIVAVRYADFQSYVVNKTIEDIKSNSRTSYNQEKCSYKFS